MSELHGLLELHQSHVVVVEFGDPPLDSPPQIVLRVDVKLCSAVLLRSWGGGKGAEMGLKKSKNGKRRGQKRGLWGLTNGAGGAAACRSRS